MKKMLLFTLSVLMTAQLLQGQALHPSAAFEISSTTQGFLPPRMTTAQRNAIQNPAVGLIVYNTNEERLEIHIGSGEWVKVSTSSGIKFVSSLPSKTGLSNGDMYYNSNNNSLNTYNNGNWFTFKPADVDLPDVSLNSLTYKPIISAGTGEIWLDRNIGATKAPASIGDTGSDTATEFGRFYTFTDAQTACPTGYRLPTKAEWELEDAHFESTQQAFDALKLTMTGYRSSGSGALGSSFVGTRGYYWSSTDDGSTTSAWFLDFNSSSARMFYNSKSFGFAVRCIKDD